MFFLLTIFGVFWKKMEIFGFSFGTSLLLFVIFSFYFFRIFAKNILTMKKIILLISFLLYGLCLSAQPDLSHISLEDKTYVDGVESVSLLPGGSLIGLPIIQLGDNLILKFDDLNEESRYYKYTLIHCTHDWKPSDMNQIEYIDGFNEDLISDYNYSFNATIKYVQYKLSFPNDNLRITKSGNYVLFVYDDTQDKPVLTRRFMVVENETASVSGDVHSSSDINFRYTKQEVDFKVIAGNYAIRNPAMTLHATIMQNGRWDNAIYGLTYRSGVPGEFSFDFDDGRNTFDGGSEFHTFDLTTLRSNADHIVSITYANHINQAYLLQDDARPFGAYESRSTLNGACYYANKDMSNPYSEDYVNTHFTLKCDFPLNDGDVYVFGQLTDWRIIPEAKLKFNENYSFWETELYLKQGLYNYQYVYVSHNSNKIDATYIEGNHYETHNQYTVLIYFQEEGSSYDKLIAVSHLSIQ